MRTWLLFAFVAPAIAIPMPFRLASLPKRHPFAFGVGITGVKTAVSDVMMQRVVLQRSLNDLDLARVRTFALFGFAYLGAWQYFLYHQVYAKIFPAATAFAAAPFAAKLSDVNGAAAVVGKVALDQALHWPLMALPSFYLLRSFSRGCGPAEALREYRINWKKDVALCAAIWVPSELLMFGILPPHAQLPFAAAVSFCYTAALSLSRGGGSPSSGKKS
jgi:protein Mpv17